MEFPSRFTEIDKINYLQREILILSISYYEMDYNIIEDKKYDALAKQLYEMMRDCPDREQSQYWYVYYDYSPATGFDLRDRLTQKDNEYLTHLTRWIIGNRRRK